MGRSSFKSQKLHHRSIDSLHPDWSRTRRWLAWLFQTRRFEVALLLSILCNLSLVIHETNLEAEARTNAKLSGAAQVDQPWLAKVNNAFIFLYMTEMAAKLYIFRCDFFGSAANILDLAIVCVDFFLFVVLTSFADSSSSFSALRIFRLGRFMRFVKYLTVFREMRMMIFGFVSAMRATVGASILIAIVITMWSIVAVQFIHPLNLELAAQGEFDNVDCERCEHAFESVWSSNLTFIQQIIAGDAWGQVTIPIIEHHWWTCIVFFAVFVTVHLALMNLILTVIVDKAMEARQQDEHHLMEERKKLYERSRQELLEIFQAMDKDEDGYLTIKDLVDGFHNNNDFESILKGMGMDETDLGVVMHVLDVDKSGEISYEEFARQVFRMRHEDERKMLFFVHSLVLDIIQMLRKDRMHLVKYFADNRERVLGVGEIVADRLPQPPRGAEAQHEDPADPEQVEPDELQAEAAEADPAEAERKKKMRGYHRFAGSVMHEGFGEGSNSFDVLDQDITVVRDEIEALKAKGLDAAAFSPLPRTPRIHWRSDGLNGQRVLSKPLADVDLAGFLQQRLEEEIMPLLLNVLEQSQARISSRKPRRPPGPKGEKDSVFFCGQDEVNHAAALGVSEASDVTVLSSELPSGQIFL